MLGDFGMSTGWQEGGEGLQFVLARELAGVFLIEGWQSANGAVRFTGRLLLDPKTALGLLTERFAPHGYTPVIPRMEEVLALPRRQVVRRRAWQAAVPAALLVATLLSTGLTGGVLYGACLMLILGCHELGHYLTARRYGVPVSVPYFLPFPLSPLGTFGAVIKMRGLMPNRKVLFDIGVAGPLAGLAVALPILVLGLWTSPVGRLEGPLLFLQEGNSLLYLLLKWLVFGPIPPGHDVLLNQVAFAGWVGLFVTGLNLLPVGSLDGGHIVYALLTRRHLLAGQVTIGLLVVTAVVFRSWSWLVMVTVAMLLGFRHPPTQNDLTPLDRRRRGVAYFALVLLVLLFVPVPMELMGP
jgi:Zn-dependent protease